MSTRQLRARLIQLEHSAKLKSAESAKRKPPYCFPIDPVVYQVLLDDLKHLNGLKNKAFDERKVGCYPPIKSPELVEALARFGERAKTIPCPPCYGFKEHWEDYKNYFSFHRTFEFDRRGEPTDHDEIRIRMEIFRQSPEGRARIRLDYLENRLELIGPAEHNEIEQLLKLYPEPWENPANTNMVIEWLEKRRKRRLNYAKPQIK
jgi:hypothetical protein